MKKLNNKKNNKHNINKKNNNNHNNNNINNNILKACHCYLDGVRGMVVGGEFHWVWFV